MLKRSMSHNRPLTFVSIRLPSLQLEKRRLEFLRQRNL